MFLDFRLKRPQPAEEALEEETSWCALLLRTSSTRVLLPTEEAPDKYSCSRPSERLRWQVAIENSSK